MRQAFASMLSGGDRRSTGRADGAVQALTRSPDRFEELWNCLTDEDAVVRMRAADALEKFSRREPATFARHKGHLLAGKADDGTPEVRWHLIAITARLELSGREARGFCAYLQDLLVNDRSRIVKVMALQGAYEVQIRHPKLADEFRGMLTFARACPWPSVSARARWLDGKPER